MSQLSIFCALHHPQGKVQKGYHVFVIILSLVTGFVLNIFNLNGSTPKSVLATTCIDCFLTAILFLETLLQLWSSSYRPHYSGCKGKLNYLHDHVVYKAVDLVGMLSYVAFCVQAISKCDHSHIISIGHLTQIFQIYRLTQRQLRLIVRTIHYKFGFILSIFLFTISILLVLSRLVYLFEKDRNNQIRDIYDATWLVFVTINCIGFGDKGPVTIEGKILIIFVAFFGLVSFSVTTSLFGAELANKKEKASIVSLIPAATLVQNVWILHSMELGMFWKNMNMKLNGKDKQAIICLQKIKCLVSSRHFKVSQSDTTAFDENILLYEHLLNRLDFIEKNIYHNSYALNSINSSMESIVREINDNKRQL